MKLSFLLRSLCREQKTTTFYRGGKKKKKGKEMSMTGNRNGSEYKLSIIDVFQVDSSIFQFICTSFKKLS